MLDFRPRLIERQSHCHVSCHRHIHVRYQCHMISRSSCKTVIQGDTNLDGESVTKNYVIFMTQMIGQNRLFSAVLENFMIVRFNDLIISRKLQLSGNEMQLRSLL